MYQVLVACMRVIMLFIDLYSALFPDFNILTFSTYWAPVSFSLSPIFSFCILIWPGKFGFIYFIFGVSCVSPPIEGFISFLQGFGTRRLNPCAWGSFLLACDCRDWRDMLRSIRIILFPAFFPP